MSALRKNKRRTVHTQPAANNFRLIWNDMILIQRSALRRRVRKGSIEMLMIQEHDYEQDLFGSGEVDHENKQTIEPVLKRS